MNPQNQSRVAKLEALLARVTARASAPRPAPIAAAPRAPVAAAPPPTAAVELPQRSIPVPLEPPRAPTPSPSPAVSARTRADELPDLEFSESPSPSGQRRPSLRPSATGPAVAPPSSGAVTEPDDSGEFDIPAHPSSRPGRPPARPAPIELDAAARGDEPIEIERTPLASAVPQAPRHGEDLGLELDHPGATPAGGRSAAEVVGGVASVAATAAAGVAVGVVAGIAAGVAAVTGGTTPSSTRHSNRPPPASALESVPLTPHEEKPAGTVGHPVVVPPASSARLEPAARTSEPGAERIAPSRALPDEASLVSAVGEARAPRPSTLRGLLARAVALRVRR